MLQHNVYTMTSIEMLPFPFSRSALRGIQPCNYAHSELNLKRSDRYVSIVLTPSVLTGPVDVLTKCVRISNMPRTFLCTIVGYNLVDNRSSEQNVLPFGGAMRSYHSPSIRRYHRPQPNLRPQNRHHRILLCAIHSRPSHSTGQHPYYRLTPPTSNSLA
jgi:hypothetical protein